VESKEVKPMGDPILNLDYKPHLPPKTDYGIAIAGCGGIVTYAALPTYVEHDLNVVGCYDVNRETAESAASQFNIPRVYDSLDDLVADPEVEIVEISVPPQYQFDIARQSIAGGKHLLCQKPLSDNLSRAAEIVRLAREAGVKLAVNQQLRWGQGIRAARTLIRKAWIGQVTDASIQVSVNTPWDMWGWLVESPRLEVLFHSIHYIDAMRSLLGDPEWITSRHTRYPLQGKLRGETKTITILDYEWGLQALIADNHYNQSDDYFATFRFIGTEGDAKLEGKWIPDAFIGPTASLMQAIQEDGEPETSGADNVQTLRVVEACYLSAAENRSVRLDECQAIPCPD
jgi:predicted dehydrogenase